MTNCEELVEKVEAIGVHPRGPVDQRLRRVVLEAVRHEIFVALYSRPRAVIRRA